MASLKDVKVKIGGVTKTKQITKAMYMVASAKLRGAQARIERFRPYAEKFYETLGELAGKTDEAAHALLSAREEVRTCGIVIATSDRGLCGSFNVNIVTEAVKLARAKEAEGIAVKFYCIGRKGRDAIRKLGYEIPLDIVGEMNNLDFQIAHKVGQEVINGFLSEELDEVILIYGRFFSLARQTASVLELLPIAPEKTEEEEASHGSGKEFLYEPTVEGILAELLPRFINVQIYRGLLDTSASEHAARMQAMDNATRNCDELVRDLTLLFNKTRQAAITTELIDIVGGVEALKG